MFFAIPEQPSRRSAYYPGSRPESPGSSSIKDGGSWLLTTLPSSAESGIKRQGELKLTDGGDLEGKLTVTYTGLEASQRRVEEHLTDAAERKKFLEDAVKES